ncbi:MAG TPA: penicillin-binding protein 2 [Candidatus Cloacimonetes bacterium]|nr:penicillin-binding protein 2 [Candidatus Cloacimonadota bacterium]
MSKKFFKADQLLLLVVVLFAILGYSLFKIQVIEGDEYKEIAEKNYFRIIKKPAKRGIIYDRNMQPLTENIPSLSLYIDIKEIVDRDSVAEFVSKNLDMPKQEILDLIHKHRFYKFAPVLIKDNLDMATAIRFEERSDDYPSLLVRPEALRYYDMPSHFVGYVGKISASEYEQYKDEEYAKTDYIGKVGLERYYEKELKGKKGYDVIQVDATGAPLELMKNTSGKPPIPGKDIVLTLDKELQQKVTEILPKDTTAVAIVMNCKTGGIISMVSTPQYDPNNFVTGMNEEYWNQITSDKRNPLLNKACSAVYPPGSVFKLVVAAYALEKNLVEPYDILVDCKGGVEYGGRHFGCWKEHGEMNMLDAIRESCDSYFYKIAEIMNLNDFKNFIEDCNLIKDLPVGYTRSRKGFFPSSEWYDKHYGELGWTRGNLLNLSIGQGEVLLTPISIACFYAGIANNGTVKRPHFADYFLQEGEKEKKYYPSFHMPISQQTIDFLKQSLYEAVNAKGRTGGMARVKDIMVGGKTGSAENYYGDTHAWFTAIAPMNDPEIVVVVFVEQGGSGADIAAKAAGKILGYYFDKKPLLRY